GLGGAGSVDDELVAVRECAARMSSASLRGTCEPRAATLRRHPLLRGLLLDLRTLRSRTELRPGPVVDRGLRLKLSGAVEAPELRRRPGARRFEDVDRAVAFDGHVGDAARDGDRDDTARPACPPALDPLVHLVEHAH